MFDQDAIAKEAEALRKQIGNLLGVNLSPEQAMHLYEAAMGAEGMELYRVITFFAYESDRCRQAGAYFSACLMVASAIEGLLCNLCLSSRQQVEETSIYQSLKKGTDYKEKILHAAFETLIQLAEEFDWVPSDVIASDLLAAAIQDFPVVSSNMFPKLSALERAAKLEAFKVESGIEMLRFLQHMRNFVHPNRWPRFGMRMAPQDFEQDCKFIYVLAHQVLNCLFSAFLRKSQTSLSQLELLMSKSPPELRAILSRFTLDMLKTGEGAGLE